MNFSGFQQGGPWRWFMSDNFLETQFIQQLSDDFPENQLVLTERKVGSDKNYLCKQIKIYTEFDQASLNALYLAPSWKRLIEIATAGEYKKSVENLIKIDLTNAHIEIILNQYYENCFMSVHTDRRPKLATQLIYLSGELNQGLGGEFMIHDENGSVLHAIEPKVGRSVIFKRTEDSYHSVNMMHKKYKRNSIQIVFWESQPSATPAGRLIYSDK